MILTIQKRLNRFRLFLTVIVLTLVWVSCENGSHQADAGENTSEDATSLPDSINNAAATKLIKLFKHESPDEFDEDFFFGGAEKMANKVISFKLDENQRKALFRRLRKHAKDNVEIRIHMALRNKDKSEVVLNKPMFAPLLQLVVNKIPDPSTYYPLRPFQSNFSTDFEQLRDCQNSTLTAVDSCFKKVKEITLGPLHQRQIDCICAMALVYNWDSISTKNISKQLYADQAINQPDSLIRYYTFDLSDTRAISGKDDKYFYVYLGQLDQENYVPLRTIVHITDKPIEPNKGPEQAAGGPAYFEFAKPCPPYCDTSQSQFVPQILDK